MGEQLRYGHEEVENNFNQRKNDEKLRAMHEAAANKHEKDETREKLGQIHEKIERKAKESEDLKQKIEKAHTKDQDTNKHWQQSTPSATKTLHMAQRQLKPASRAFSKFIHNSTVETISDVTGGTIARPYGLLWAGILAFIIPLCVLIICKHYGYTYNAFIAIASFSGGFLLGLLIESLQKVFAKNPH